MTLLAKVILGLRVAFIHSPSCRTPAYLAGTESCCCAYQTVQLPLNLSLKGSRGRMLTDVRPTPFLVSGHVERFRRRDVDAGRLAWPPQSHLSNTNFVQFFCCPFTFPL